MAPRWRRTGQPETLPFELVLENVRCFQGRHEIRIRPLTFLVGENSTGKSTVMAVLAAVSSGTASSLYVDFSTPPYDLGPYPSIASHVGDAERARSFSIGYQGRRTDGSTLEVLLTFVESSGQPRLARLRTRRPLDSESTGSSEVIDLDIMARSPSSRRHSIQADSGTESIWTLQDRVKDNAHWVRLVDALGLIVEEVGFLPSRSLAPVRTRPRRTYDEISDAFRPEGDHIPVVLSRILSRAEPELREPLVSALRRFGQESGLFRDLRVRRLGSADSDPFQVEVDVSGRATNIADVGYGVSQAIPVVVESLLLAPERRMLLQQPEVHLHPRAQAALGSFFVDLVANNHKEFVVETHSDYMVDRARIEVARGRIPPESLGILFFERKDREVVVHDLTVDAQGNLLGAPPSYRQFFLEEDLRLLSRGMS